MRGTIAALLLAALVAASPMANAQWRVASSTDSMTDETRSMALVVNPAGFTFGVYRLKSGAVWGMFSLPDRFVGTLDPKTPIMFRVDKNEPSTFRDLPGLERIGIKTYEWKPKFSNFLLWHGKEEDGRSLSIRALMTGSTLLVRYYLLGASYEETSFDLVGASTSIAQALDIAERTDPEQDARIAAYLAVQVASMRACTDILRAGNPSGGRACSERLSACGKQANRDAEALKACVAAPQ